MRKRNKRTFYHSGVAGTLKGLITPNPRTHDANFSRILPRKMAQLVAEGLFEPDGNGSYRITEKGRAKLAELEGGSSVEKT